MLSSLISLSNESQYNTAVPCLNATWKSINLFATVMQYSIIIYLPYTDRYLYLLSLAFFPVVIEVLSDHLPSFEFHLSSPAKVVIV